PSAGLHPRGEPRADREHRRARRPRARLGPVGRGREMSGAATLDSFTSLWEEWRTERDRVLAEPYGILSITSINFLTAEPVPIEGVPGRWSTSEDGPVVELAPGEELLDGDRTVTGRLALGP